MSIIHSISELKIEEYGRIGQLKANIFHCLHKYKLIAPTMPKGFAGASLVEARQAVRAIVLGEPSTALIVVMQYLFAPSVARSRPFETFHCQNAIAAAKQAFALTENPGIARTNALERHYRDILCSRLHTSQDDAVLVAAGKHAFSDALRDRIP